MKLRMFNPAVIKNAFNNVRTDLIPALKWFFEGEYKEAPLDSLTTWEESDADTLASSFWVIAVGYVAGSVLRILASLTLYVYSGLLFPQLIVTAFWGFVFVAIGQLGNKFLEKRSIKLAFVFALTVISSILLVNTGLTLVSSLTRLGSAVGIADFIRNMLMCLGYLCVLDIPLSYIRGGHMFVDPKTNSVDGIVYHEPNPFKENKDGHIEFM